MTSAGLRNRLPMRCPMVTARSTTGLMRVSYDDELIELSGPIATAIHATDAR